MLFNILIAAAGLSASVVALSIGRRGSTAIPASCPGLTDRFPLETAPGWSHVKIAGNLQGPRGLAVDPSGNILLVEAGKGVTALQFGQDGCVANTRTILDKTDLNHGIALSPDGSQLIVSSETTVWRYNYDAQTSSLGNEEVIVQNMGLSGHTSRTVVIPPQTPNILIVSHGSDGNLDYPSIDKSLGRALVKTYDLGQVPPGGYDFSTQGNFLGYGLRNEVAIIPDNNNMIWGAENSGDDFTRTLNGVSTDIHNGNPAEELNFLGDPTLPNENWYGYPTCFTVWDGGLFPDDPKPATGFEFIPAPSDTFTDATCNAQAIPPRLALESHGAPIDGAFNADNTALYVTLHGSWNSDVPSGYKIVEIPFQNGGNGYEPVAAQDSMDGYSKILWDIQDGCDSSKCLRPSGLVFSLDSSRIFFASDGNEGEVFILYKT